MFRCTHIDEIKSLQNRVDEIVEQNNRYCDTFKPSFGQSPHYCESIVNLLKLTQNLKQDLLQNALHCNPYNRNTCYMYEKVCILESELNNLVRSIKPIVRIVNKQRDSNPRGHYNSSSFSSKRNFSYSYVDALPSKHSQKRSNRGKHLAREVIVKSPSLYKAEMYFENLQSQHLFDTNSNVSDEEVLYYYLSSPASDISKTSSSDEDLEEEMPIQRRTKKGLIKKHQAITEQKPPHNPRSPRISPKIKKSRSKSTKFRINKSEPSFGVHSSKSSVQRPESEVFLVKKKRNPKTSKYFKKDRFFVSRLKRIKSATSRTVEQNNKPRVNQTTVRSKSRTKSKKEKEIFRIKPRATKQRGHHGYLRESNSKGRFEKNENELKETETPQTNFLKVKNDLRPKGQKHNESIVVAYSYNPDISNKNVFLKEGLQTYSHLGKDNYTQTSNHRKNSNVGKTMLRLSKGENESMKESMILNYGNSIKVASSVNKQGSKVINERHDYISSKKNHNSMSTSSSNVLIDTNINSLDLEFSNNQINSEPLNKNVFLLKIDENDSMPVLLKSRNSELKSSSKYSKQQYVLKSFKDDTSLRKETLGNVKPNPFNDATAPSICITAVPDVQENEQINRNIIGPKKFYNHKHVPHSNNSNLNYNNKSLSLSKNVEILQEKGKFTLADDFSNTSKPTIPKNSTLDHCSLGVRPMKSSKSETFFTAFPFNEGNISVYEVENDHPSRKKSLSRIWSLKKNKSKASITGNNSVTDVQPPIKKTNSKIKRFFSQPKSKTSDASIDDMSANQINKLKKKSLPKIWPLNKNKSKASVIENNSVSETQPPTKRTNSKIKRIFSSSKSKPSIAAIDNMSIAAEEREYSGASKKSVESFANNTAIKTLSDDQQISKGLLKKTSSWTKMKQVFKGTNKSKKSKKNNTLLEKTESTSGKSGKSKTALKRLFSRDKQKKKKSRLTSKESTEPGTLSNFPRSVSGYYEDQTQSTGSVISLTQPFESMNEEDQKSYGIQPHLKQKMEKQAKQKQTIVNNKEVKDSKIESSKDKKELRYSLHYTKEKHRCVELNSIPSDLTLDEILPNCKTLRSTGETVLCESKFEEDGKISSFDRIYIIPKHSHGSNAEYEDKCFCKVCQKRSRNRQFKKIYNFDACSDIKTRRYIKKSPVMMSDQALSDCSSFVDWNKIARKMKSC